MFAKPLDPRFRNYRQPAYSWILCLWKIPGASGIHFSRLTQQTSPPLRSFRRHCAAVGRGKVRICIRVKKKGLWHGALVKGQLHNFKSWTSKNYNIANITQFPETFQTVTTKPKVRPARRRENTLGYTTARSVGRLPSKARMSYR